MIQRVWAIALNTHREALRQKILYTLVFFTAVLILFSLFLGQLTLGADVKIIKDMGLASIMVFGCLISIFVGVGLVFKEIDSRTIYTILSKPVSRAEFILGKFLGLATTVGLEVFVMTTLLFGFLSFYPEPLDFNLLKAVILIYAELCILVAVALLFSSYSSSFMSILFCIAFLVIGHLTDDLAEIFEPRFARFLADAEGIKFLGAKMLSGFVWLLKHFSLDHFAINDKIVHGVCVHWGWVANSLFYAFLWLILLLAAAMWLFRRKDLQ